MGKGWYNFLTFVLLASSAIAGVLFYIEWAGVMEENRQLLQTYQNLQRRADALEEECNYKNRYYNRLISDDKFASRVIREKLGYAEPDDIVFRFKDSEEAEPGEIAVPDTAKKLQKTETFYGKVLAFFGFKKSQSAESESAAQVQRAPELRVDMTGASIDALRNKKILVSAERAAAAEQGASAEQGGPVGAAIEGSLAGNAHSSGIVLQEASLDISAGSTAAEKPRGTSRLVEADMKPVKLRLGATSKLKYARARPAKPVRFSSR